MKNSLKVWTLTSSTETQQIKKIRYLISKNQKPVPRSLLNNHYFTELIFSDSNGKFIRNDLKPV